MSAAGLWALASEARSVIRTMRDERPRLVGPVVVSGMLSEQLARELDDGASPGAVNVGGTAPSFGAEVIVHVIAGDPTESDDELFTTADRSGTPVVIVQLWPQADWTPPFVRSPFVVECRAGEGFPLREIAARITEASGHAPILASRIPALSDAVTGGIVRRAILQAGVLSIAGGSASRPRIALEQVRMLSRLRVAATGASADEELPVVAGMIGATVAAGFGFRAVARAVRRLLPEPLADVAVAAGGTWVLAKAIQQLEAVRTGSA